MSVILMFILLSSAAPAGVLCSGGFPTNRCGAPEACVCILRRCGLSKEIDVTSRQFIEVRGARENNLKNVSLDRAT
jgi:hypothetical protein